jgi:hypothetical protein
MMLNVRCWRSEQTPMLECGNAGFDPIRTLAGQFCCYAQPYSGSPCGSPNVAHGAGARIGLRVRGELAVELGKQ